ncbi:hypothetical protein ACIQPQ_02295 [Streptomyces sp. NPDC091281]|uniref:hypothetical protein n=1 Tax=Streptomyces sp. NPDC091281 TaxID=3365985 RepID=UPI00380E21EF
MLRTRFAQAAAVASLAVVTALAAPALVAGSGTQQAPFSSVFAGDAGWQSAPADSDWTVLADAGWQ